MYSGAIQSERELDALRHELEGLRNRKGDLEDSLLEIMEQQEEVGSLLDTLDERAAEIGTRVQELALARDTAAGRHRRRPRPAARAPGDRDRRGARAPPPPLRRAARPQGRHGGGRPWSGGAAPAASW